MNSPPLSPSVEDYLKAVYSLNEGGGPAGTNELARVLAVRPGSVSGMIRRLAEDGLLQHEPYRGVRLTEEGSREALKILRRHRIIESFLVQRLGYDWDDVHAEAEQLEHAASERLIEAMAEALGHPATDPHGAPIPTRTGRIEPSPAKRLDEMVAGSRVTVRSVADEDPVRLRYLKSVGLVPGARAVVRKGGGEEGAVTVTVEGGSGPLRIRRNVASRVTVSETDQSGE
ncbi:MAG: metal-dependent transcriptional regulator [Gemmatimonadota bacterium]|nr:metal-dependent transcriptional regulator [Gemmatimonadota bacterium]MDE2985359.1 metal-dependent transcriptional regulator [Gemmatimonadota bacterium]